MSKHNKERFSNRLKELIKEKGIQQKDLVTDFHVTKQTVSRWCNAHIVPDEATITLLSNYFEVDRYYLLGLTDKRNYQQIWETYDKEHPEILECIHESLSIYKMLEEIGYDLSIFDEESYESFESEIKAFIKFKYESFKENNI